MNEEFELTVEVEETSSARESANKDQTRKQMQKLQLEPGKKYRGSFWVNDFGEFHCNPEQKGTNPQGMRLVTEGEMHKLFTTKNTVRIVITLDRGDYDHTSAQFTQAVTKAMVDLLKYNLQK